MRSNPNTTTDLKILLMTLYMLILLALSLAMFSIHPFPYIAMVILTHTLLCCVQRRWELRPGEINFFSMAWPLTILLSYWFIKTQETAWRTRVVQDVLED